MQHQKGNLIQEVTAGIIIHQVNCQGKMMSGFAKELRETYPVVYDDFEKLSKFVGAPAMLLGMVQPVMVSPELVVVNLFSQERYGYDGVKYTSYDAMDKGLSELAHWLIDNQMGDIPIHHPLIGCDRGGGKWHVVKAIIEANLGPNTTLWTLK